MTPEIPNKMQQPEFEMPQGDEGISFQQLAERIVAVDESLRQQAAHAINCMLTARNWLIGCHIVEFEQNGADRAQYGEQLLKTLARKINRKGMDDRRLREYRQFYRAYPYLGNVIRKYLVQEASPKFLQSVTAKSKAAATAPDGVEEIWRSSTAIFEQMQLEPWQTPPERLFHRLSATHLIMLSIIDDSLKRAFYEQQVIQGCWTVKELDRQISTLYYERSALSKDKAALQRKLGQQTRPQEPKLVLRDPMTLEFLGIPQAEVHTETKLETAILNNLQKFLLELGQGFCFEARQKRVLIDHDYLKADLIFYNRILHCHFIVDLKVDRYRHEYGSQLNTYKNYYRHEIMQPEDNPPIGLLLCTEYNETLVQYSTEGLDDIYVGKYMLQLPSTESIRQYLIDNMPAPEELEEDTNRSPSSRARPGIPQ